MVYGSSSSEEVLILRRFRDEKLKKQSLGDYLCDVLRIVSTFVKIFKNSSVVNQFTKRQLDKFVCKLKTQNKKL